MDIKKSLKKATSWGFYLAIVCCSVASLLGLFSNYGGLTEPSEVWFYVFFLGILGAVLGFCVGLFMVAIIDTIKFFHWLFIFLAGSIISILTPFINGVVGLYIVSIVPILFILKKYLNENSPKWIDQALNNAMIMFLTSLIFTGLTFVFKHFTGISLPVPNLV
ncbi:hypothetical protein NIES21_10270 [Anabaenopsis circularis NIES-21]|uniref:Uncharacterized protein n=1 Tax=Anabaenopsis circularis NIES-21 TaxID=1085406 RepID=A0A1Z4GCK1_9CYAN|nr:hypothetical protein NIES21_10270 [Anabaenopsis circularis NIES-21]